MRFLLHSTTAVWTLIFLANLIIHNWSEAMLTAVIVFYAGRASLEHEQGDGD